jgi:hypothetical protein
MAVFPNLFSMKEPLKQFVISQGTPISENFKGQEKLLAWSAIHFLLKYCQEKMFLDNATILFEEVRMFSFGS